jgi:hypothetical protein
LRIKNMKGITFLVIGLILIVASLVAPKLLSPDLGQSIVVVLTRPAGVICFLIGLIRVFKERKS